MFGNWKKEHKVLETRFNAISSRARLASSAFLSEPFQFTPA